MIGTHWYFDIPNYIGIFGIAIQTGIEMNTILPVFIFNIVSPIKIYLKNM